MKKLDLTKNEEQMLELIWKIGKPITSLELMDYSNGKVWSKNSLHMLLRSLKDKKIIEECGYVKISTKHATLFRAKMSKEEYFSKLFLQKGGNSRELLSSFAALVSKDRTVDKDELINELEKIVQKLKDEG